MDWDKLKAAMSFSIESAEMKTWEYIYFNVNKVWLVKKLKLHICEAIPYMTNTVMSYKTKVATILVFSTISGEKMKNVRIHIL